VGLSSQSTPICSNGCVCTAIIDLAPGEPALLAGLRDEFVDRAWQPPGRHWPDHPDLAGGRDLLAGGTWLAVAPGAARATCILNGRGRAAAAGGRRTRGILPLQVAEDGKLSSAGLDHFDPFHLLSVQPPEAMLWTWDGEHLTERELGPGLHLMVNSGLGSDLLSDGGGARAPGSGDAGPRGSGTARGSDPREHELARLAHFVPRFRAAQRPRPRPGGTMAQAWGAWLPLLNGDGLSPDDPRALIVRRDLGDGRVWGTTSVSLVALWPDRLRYDFTAAPGDPGAWYEVAL
jgi:Transport and Golgi organisation 2